MRYSSLLFAVSAVLLFMGTSQALASSVEVTSPAAGAQYYLGDTMHITWTPVGSDTYTGLGVKNISIRSVGHDEYNVGISGAKVYGDPINYSGSYSYTLPIYTQSFNTSDYRVHLELENGTTVYSDIFRITNPDHPEPIFPEDIQYFISEVETETPYYTDEPISVGLTVWEKTGVLFDPSKGFNVQARIRKSTSNSAFDSLNGSFTGGEWILRFDPISEPGEYVIHVSAYCGLTSTVSYCSNTYKKDQYEKTITIQVKDRLESKDLDLRVDPLEIKNGGAAMIRWNNTGADYYVLGAGNCEAGVYTGGKARPDLCTESERIPGEGKDVMLINDITFHNSSKDTSTLQLKLVSYVDDERVQTDRIDVTVLSDWVESETPVITGPANLSVNPGDVVTLVGKGMGSGQYIEFVGTGVTASVTAYSATSIAFVVPALDSGKYYIRVRLKASDVKSNTLAIVVGGYQTNPEPVVTKPRASDDGISMAQLIELFIALGIIPEEKAEQARTLLVTQGQGEAKETSSNMCSAFSRDLSVGSRGEDVIRLQEYLRDNGYLVVPNGVALGYYGSLTKAAVTKYQQKMGISPAVGYFGPATRAKIKAFDC